MKHFFLICSMLLASRACVGATAGPPVCSDQIPAADMQRFDDFVGKREYVVLGESSHYMTAVHCLVGQVFRNLVEKKGYRVLVFESAWGIDDGLRDYLAGDRTEVTPQESFFLNAFNSAPTRELLQWVREFNRTHTDPVRLAGVQPEQPVTDFHAIWKYAAGLSGFEQASAHSQVASCKADSADYKTDIDFISFASKLRRKEHRAAFTDEERAACLAGLDALEGQLKKGRADADKREALLHIDSLRGYYRYLAPVGDSLYSGQKLTPEKALEMGGYIYNHGDEARFHVFDTLRQTRYSKQKALFWMHNWHAAHHSEDLVYTGQIPAGTISLGTRLAKAYGSQLLTVGNVTACPRCTVDPPADAIEKKFETVLNGTGAFVDVKQPVGRQTELPLNTAGTLLLQLDTDRLERVVLSRQFDGILYLPISGLTFEDEKPRYADTPDLKTILPKFLSKEGYLDRDFALATAKPSPFYGDFYGVQALADITRARVKTDFVSKIAELVSEDDHSITLKFPSGFTATFYPHSSLNVMGATVPFDHMTVSGDDWREIQKNLEAFRAILKEQHLEKAYLIPNPHYADELVVEKRWQSASPAAAISVDPALALLETSKNAIFLAPEGVHGNVEGYEKLKKNLAGIHLDWFGMEMLTADMQKDLDAFNNAKDRTPEYAAARKKMVDYFAAAWNGRAGPKTTGEENYYFKLVDQLHASGTRVIGLEDTDLAYILFRYGENAFGAAVRSYLWAKACPATGKGAIFGGSGHFTESKTVNVQDFLADRFPGVALVSAAPIQVRKQ